MMKAGFILGNSSGLIAALLVIAAGFPVAIAAQQPSVKFQPKLLTVDANEGIDIADVDGDGKLDIVAGRNWFQAPEFAPRPLRMIDDWNGYVESNGDFTYDVNQDGRIDVIAGSFLPTEVHWYENPGSEGLMLGQLWKKHLLVDTQLSNNEGSFLRDFNGDDQPEWISNSWKKENPVVIWELQQEERTVTQTQGRGANARQVEKTVRMPTLKKHLVGAEGNTHGMGFGDINNDGREDILIATGWYERPDGDWKTRWKFHPDWDYLHASVPMIVRDVNRDGRNDLIWGKGHDYGLYWWESTGVGEDGKLKFEQHLIDDRFSQPHSLHMADLDGDGNEELITGKRVRAHNGRDPGGQEMPCMYYYQWDEQSGQFHKHVIDEGHIGTGLQIRTADIDGDGRIDLAVAGKDGTWILFNQGTREP